MSSVLKVKTAYPLKFEGKQYKAGEDLTDIWNPDQFNHMQMFLHKQVNLVKEELPVAKKSVTKRQTKK